MECLTFWWYSQYLPFLHASIDSLLIGLSGGSLLNSLRLTNTFFWFLSGTMFLNSTSVSFEVVVFTQGPMLVFGLSVVLDLASLNFSSSISSMSISRYTLLTTSVSVFAGSLVCVAAKLFALSPTCRASIATSSDGLLLEWMAEENQVMNSLSVSLASYVMLRRAEFFLSFFAGDCKLGKSPLLTQQIILCSLLAMTGTTLWLHLLASF